MDIYILLSFFAAFVGILTFLLLKKAEYSVILLYILGLVLDVFLIGVFCGIRMGESNVLKGKPTYRMVINYQKIDSVVSIKDTTYILK